MMTVQANPYRGGLVSILSTRGQSRRQSHARRIVSFSVNSCPRLVSVHGSTASASLSFAPLSNHRRSISGSRYFANTAFCMLGGGGGKDFSEDGNKGFSSWNPVGKPMESSGGKSIEDVLRDQIEKKEYHDGGSGKKPPRFGFFRFFGFGGEGSGGSGNGSLADHFDEIVQVFVAFVAFALMYFFFLSGPEMLLLCSDYIKYLFGRRPSVRLKKELDKWGMIHQGLTQRVNPDKHWLEVAILNTTTWFDSPDKYWTHRPEEYQESGESSPRCRSEFKNRITNGSADSDDDRSVSSEDSDSDSDSDDEN